MWFFFNHRRIDSADAQPGIFANKNAGDPTKWTYVPDFTRQGRIDQSRKIYSLRLTTQITPRNKLMLFWDEQPQCSGAAWPGSPTTTRLHVEQGRLDLRRQPEQRLLRSRARTRRRPATTATRTRSVQQVKYTSPATNKLLLEAGFGTYISQWGYDGAARQSDEESDPRPGTVGADLRSSAATELRPRAPDCLTVGGNLKYRSSNWPTGYIFAHTWNASASYVTGAHNMKFGYQGAYHRDDDNLFPTISNDQLMQLTLNNGVPNAIHRSSRVSSRAKCARRYYAFFAQDQWTKDRLTLQGALRFDRAWSSFPEQTIGPSVTIPTAIVLDAQSGITGYNDISPRIGAAYDVFGNGKTSLKANVGRYLHPASNQGRYINANPSERVSTITARPWTDTNGNFVPDCNVLDGRAQSPATTGSIDTCGAWVDPNFGRARPSTTLSDSILGGWGARPYDWQFGVSVQQEVVPTGLRRSRVLPPVVADLRRR